MRATFSYDEERNALTITGATLTDYVMLAHAVHQAAPRDHSTNSRHFLVRLARMVAVITRSLRISGS